MVAYAENRKNLPYYKYLRTLLAVVSFNADSILDVGSHGVDMVSFLPCKQKVSIDLNDPLEKEGIVSIKADFIEYDFRQKFDIVTCFQVMEHIDDVGVYKFAKKLMSLAQNLLIVSVPYKWPIGKCERHVQDPVDEEKFYKWFSVESEDFNIMKPVFSRVIYTENAKYGRLIVVFAKREVFQNLELLNGVDNWLFKYRS